MRNLLAALFIALAFAGAAFGETATVSAQVSSPRMMGIAELRGGLEGLAIIDGSGKVRVGELSRGKVDGWRVLTGSEGAVGLTGDETGLLLVITKREGDYWLHSYRFGEPERSPKKLLIPKKLEGLSGASAGNGMLWLVFREPVTVAFFAYDGQMLGEAESAEVLRAPLSVALSPMGEAYVTDPMGPAIVKFRSSGQREVVMNLNGSGMARPTGVTVGSDGVAVVCDGLTGRAARLMISGGSWNLKWLNEKPMEEPLRLGGDPLSQWGVFAAEARSGRILRLKEQK